MKYAVIESGSKQYRIQEGDVIEVDLLQNNDDGKEVVFSHVLALHNNNKIEIGTPHVKNAEVKGIIETVVKDRKVIIFKYTKRKNNRTKNGHRQRFARVRITEIQGN